MKYLFEDAYGLFQRDFDGREDAIRWADREINFLGLAEDFEDVPLLDIIAKANELYPEMDTTNDDDSEGITQDDILEYMGYGSFRK